MAQISPLSVTLPENDILRTFRVEESRGPRASASNVGMVGGSALLYDEENEGEGEEREGHSAKWLF